MYFYETCINDVYSFYNNIGKLNFKDISDEKILELKECAKTFNKFLHNHNIKIAMPQKYATIANKIKTNPKGYGVTNNNEKALLFMFSVDPNFEAAIIFAETNKISETKNKMINYFGIYDINLINIENYYIKHYLSKVKRKEIYDEINKRTK